jgi:hypothetical protein
MAHLILPTTGQSPVAPDRPAARRPGMDDGAGTFESEPDLAADVHAAGPTITLSRNPSRRAVVHA